MVARQYDICWTTTVRRTPANAALGVTRAGWMSGGYYSVTRAGWMSGGYYSVTRAGWMSGGYYSVTQAG